MFVIMRFVLDIFGQIFRTLWAHKLRSFLTMFGVAWGVGSLLLLVGLGEGFRSGNKRGLAEFGEDIMFIFPGRAPVVAGSMNSARNYLLTYQDYADVRKLAPHVRNASPVLSRDDVRAVSEFASANGQIAGVEPQYSQIRYLPLKQGRWLNSEDETQRRNVIVLGDELTRNLFLRTACPRRCRSAQRRPVRSHRHRETHRPRGRKPDQHARLYSLPHHGDLLPA